jgi:hypothetical protein
MQRVDEVILVGLDELGGGHRHCVLPGIELVASRAAGGRARR